MVLAASEAQRAGVLAVGSPQLVAGLLANPASPLPKALQRLGLAGTDLAETLWKSTEKAGKH
jgi:Clp amino terminal domain, pathogenicity island component